MKKLSVLILSSLILASCGSSNKNEKTVTTSNASSNNQTAQEGKEVKKENTNVELNNIACFLGGTTPKNAGEFSAAFNSASWKLHQSTLNTAWEKALKEKINPMREWSKNEKIGEKACPFNSLYWNFFLVNAQKLGKNPRLGIVFKQLRDMNPDLLKDVQSQARQYIQNIETL